MRIYMIIIGALSFLSSKAQLQSTVWIAELNGVSHETPNAIALDAANNVYGTGSFYDTMHFASHDLISNGKRDVFIYKMSALGEVLWAKSLGGSNLDVGQSVATDAEGNAYVLGYYSQTIDFDPGPATLKKPGIGFQAVFLQKFDTHGNLQWVRTFGSSGSDDGKSITIDPNGNVYLTGTFFKTLNLNDGSVTQQLTSKEGSSDAYVIKLDGSGKLLWMKQIGGAGSDQGLAICTDQKGNVYASGTCRGDFDLVSKGGDQSIMANGYDVFIQKLDPDGNAIWTKVFGGSGMDMAQSIKADASGNIYITGTFSATADLDPGPETKNLVAEHKGFEIYLLKLDTNGEFVWAKDIGKGSGNALCVDASGSVYLTGYLYSGLNAGKLDLGTTFGGFFLLKLDNSGDVKKMHQINENYKVGRSVAVDLEGGVYVTGVKSEGGSEDIFVLKMK